MTEQYFVTSKRKPGEAVYADGYVYGTYAEAETYAKKKAAKSQDDFIIMKDFATAKAVVPAIEVVKH